MNINNEIFPLISICIPTYNRKDFLKILLESIISQADPEFIQIVISDNASTDGTSLLVDEFKSKYSNLIYRSATENLGADRNYLASVKNATGKYCWLMGSDDALKPGSIKHLLKYIDLDLEIYLTGRIECSFDLEPIKNRNWIEIGGDFKVFNFEKSRDLEVYFEACNSLGGVFSYLSSIVVKRSSWENIQFNEIFIGTAYSHVSILLSIMVGGARLGYIKEPLVYSRSGNDSFLTDWVDRALLDLKGYKLLGEKIIACKSSRKAFYDIMHREYSSIALIKTKILSPSSNWWELVTISVNTYLISPWIFRTAAVLYWPGRFILRLKRGLKKYKNKK